MPRRATRQRTGPMGVNAVGSDGNDTGTEGGRILLAKTRREGVDASEHINSREEGGCKVSESKDAPALTSTTREVKSIWYAGSAKKAVTRTRKTNVTSSQPKLTVRHTSSPEKMSFFLIMPIDVFCEIAGYMSAQDILRLSWVSRSLCASLSSKMSRQIWRAAQSNIGLPACPPDICEPHYAKLIFERDCHVCGAAKINKADFAMRVRLCEGCMKLNVDQGFNLAKYYGRDVARDPQIYTLVPFQQSAQRGPGLGDADMKVQKFYRPDFQQALTQYLDLASDPVAQEKFVVERQKLTLKVIQHAKDTNDWLHSKIEKKHHDPKSAAISRKDSIFARLKELGISELELSLHSKRSDKYTKTWNSLVDQPRELTPRIWNMIRPNLEAIIHARKNDIRRDKNEWHLEQRRKEISVFYFEHVQTMDLGKHDARFIPSADEFCHIPAISQLLDKDCEMKLTEQGWESVVPLLPDLFRNYKCGVIRQCCSAYHGALRHLEASGEGQAVVAKATPSDEEADSILRRATVFFQHPNGYSNLTYPEVLRHMECNFERAASSSDQWTLYGAKLSGNTTTMLIAFALLDNLGVPRTTTMAEMDSRAFHCLCCDPHDREPESWTDIVKHFNFEQRWYNEAISAAARYENEAVPILNDHDLRSDTKIIAIVENTDQNMDEPSHALDEPSDEALDTASVMSDEEIYIQFYCIPCERIGLEWEPNGPGRRRLRLESHIRSRHGLEPTAENLSEGYW